VTILGNYFNKKNRLFFLQLKKTGNICDRIFHFKNMFGKMAKIGHNMLSFFCHLKGYLDEHQETSFW
jgi:hypothetical protein